jgi:phosphatidylserine/phosphatidylglycerophosphate/cardiolipin synthase-like enzyme
LENCRAQLLTLIRNETQGIDIAYWYMSDLRYSTEIIARFKAGVPVRILMDVRVGENKPNNGPTLAAFRDSGIPMRKKSAGGILHWKMMLFHGQNMVEFSKANYSGESFVPIQAGVNYTDEAVYFTDDDALTNTFRTKFDDMWTNTTTFKNYANVSGPLVRHYPQFSRSSAMNFPPGQDFGARAVSRYNAETERIDVISFRITDARHANAFIAAVRRGVPVRVITEPESYRDTKRPEHAMNVDRMYMAGVKIKSRTHLGLTHEAAIILHHLGEVIFGSSNLSPYSADYQTEHNFFYRPSLGKPWFYQWFVDQFQRKWNSTSDYAAFQPMGPGAPAYVAPANGAANVPYAATLVWDGGNWAGKYDLYFGTSSTPPLAARDLVVGSPETGVRETYVVSNLKPGTRYYWRIVAKTMANKTASGPTWSFITAASSATGSGAAPNIVLYAGRATVKAGNG